MTIWVIDKDNKKETALSLESIEWDETTDSCRFTTVNGRKGKINKIKKGSNKIFVYNAFKNLETYGNVIWEE